MRGPSGGPARPKRNARADFGRNPLPPAGPVPVNLIGNVNGSTLAAEAEIVHRGRTTMVVDVRVFDALGGRAGR